MFPPTVGVSAPVSSTSCTYGGVVTEYSSEHLRLCLWHWTYIFYKENISNLYFLQRECLQLIFFTKRMSPTNIAAGQRPERWAIGKVILVYILLVLSIQGGARWRSG
jgi:hypothetical protein